MSEILSVLILIFLRNFFIYGLIIYSLWIWIDEQKKYFIFYLITILNMVDTSIVPIPAKGVIGLSLAIVFSLYNRHLSPWGYPCIFAGGFLNNLVKFVNNSKMPALEYDAEKTFSAASYVLMSGNTRLNVFADWIPTPVAGSYASVGDVIGFIGAFVLIYEIACYRKNKKH